MKIFPLRIHKSSVFTVMSSLFPSLLFIGSLVLLTACGGGVIDDTTAPVPGRIISGTAQKGPAFAGGLIDVYELDSQGQRTGRSLLTTTQGDWGGFTIAVPGDWLQFIEVVFAGTYLSEVNGQPAAPVRLSAIYDSLSSSRMAVNVLTSLAVARASVLLNENQIGLEVALNQAYQGLAETTGIPAIEIAGSYLPDTGSQAALASMLLLSGAVLDVAITEQTTVQTVIDELTQDFSTDGLFDGLGDQWLRRVQTQIRGLEAGYLGKYLGNLSGLSPPVNSLALAENLPEVIPFASRPQAVINLLSATYPVCSGNEFMVSATGSTDSDGGNNIRYTWFTPFAADGTIKQTLVPYFEEKRVFRAPVVEQGERFQFILLAEEPCGSVDAGTKCVAPAVIDIPVAVCDTTDSAVLQESVYADIENVHSVALEENVNTSVAD